MPVEGGIYHSGRAVLRLLAVHGWVVIFVLIMVVGELLGHWSLNLISAVPWRSDLALQYQDINRDASSIGRIILVQPIEQKRRSFGIPTTGEQIVPDSSAPIKIPDAFREVHILADGETLGDLAQRYHLNLASIVWSNGLERGDALMLDQPLRIPRVSGVPYIVARGETVTLVAERFGVSREAILMFEPNHLEASDILVEGMEIFIPGANPPLSAELLMQGGVDALAQRRAEPSGVVLADETNVRGGPGIAYSRQMQLERGRQVALRARYGGWLKVEIAGVVGWVRTDLLGIADGLIDLLPQAEDVPPPPARWVWPTWGALTSPFGSRWSSFHNGIDIANRAWTPIVAARAGWVQEAGWCSGYGYCVKLSHGGGVETIYGHLIANPSVSVGEEVAVGQQIGAMGSTYDRAGGGYSTGVHLHFTVLVNGRAVNPLTFLP
ncbi:MAG: peptidoglycan DD-metalloendopeptidase family protein [Oscillochloris sp.]|nr:peptidoglycan DD-metalloendopeptidase family protein [Oscillochloris sp.]